MTVPDKPEERHAVPAATMENPFTTRLEVRRSVFIAQTARCSGSEQAREFVSAIRGRFPDATHHCWAFVGGPPGDTARIGFSDDGEPHGTAGRPILNVLLHCGAGQIAAVVSRWFGGVKLGTGGLVRAYQAATLENVERMPRVMLTARVHFRARCAYGQLDAFRRLLSDMEGGIESEEYGANVDFLFSLPADRIEEATFRIREISSGAIKPERLPGP